MFVIQYLCSVCPGPTTGLLLKGANLLEGIQKVTKSLLVYSEIASDEEAEQGAQDETPMDMIVANTAEQSPAIVANTAEQMPSGLFLAE